MKWLIQHWNSTMIENYEKPWEVIYKDVEMDEENQALIFVTV